jgi:dihydroorotate dehydrogenase
MLGFSPNFRDSLPWSDFGAFVTNPVSLRPRLPAAQPARVNYPGGLLLHTGLPNPGFKAVIRKYAAQWARSDLQVTVHLMADRSEETVSMVRALEGMENVVAVELGFAPLLADDIIELAAGMCVGELPLIINLPAEQILRLSPRLMDFGAATVSLAAPRGVLSGNDGMLVAGRLYGPSLLPQTLEIVQSVSKLGIPVIAAGGIYSLEDSANALSVGALAFQMDTVLWSGAELLGSK